MIAVLGWGATAMSFASFLLFVYLSARRAPALPVAGAGNVAQHAGLSDVVKVAEAVAKLADSFAKAGPALSALVASIVFLLLALVAAGIDRLPVR